MGKRFLIDLNFYMHICDSVIEYKKYSAGWIWCPNFPDQKFNIWRHSRFNFVIFGDREHLERSCQVTPQFFRVFCFQQFLLILSCRFSFVYLYSSFTLSNTFLFLVLVGFKRVHNFFLGATRINWCLVSFWHPSAN